LNSAKGGKRENMRWELFPPCFSSRLEIVDNTQYGALRSYSSPNCLNINLGFAGIVHGILILRNRERSGSGQEIQHQSISKSASQSGLDYKWFSPSSIFQLAIRGGMALLGVFLLHRYV